MKHKVQYREGGFNSTTQTAEVCDHEHAVPVDLSTGERVAWLCPDCDEQLPADFMPLKPKVTGTPFLQARPQQQSWNSSTVEEFRKDLATFTW